jgi:hypothetical protein
MASAETDGIGPRKGDFATKRTDFLHTNWEFWKKCGQFLKKHL